MVIVTAGITAERSGLDLWRSPLKTGIEHRLIPVSTRLSRALLWLLTLFPLAATAVTLEGKVVAVTDGDTLTLLDASRTQHKIRLQGIDAPEKGQPYGQRAKENLSRLVYGRSVRAECPKRDRYGRQVCTVWVLAQDVGLAQITQGLAWHYKRYESEQTAKERVRYAGAEVEARGKRLGLWGDKAPVAPWEWRDAESRRRSR